MGNIIKLILVLLICAFSQVSLAHTEQKEKQNAILEELEKSSNNEEYAQCLGYLYKNIDGEDFAKEALQLILDKNAIGFNALKYKLSPEKQTVLEKGQKECMRYLSKEFFLANIKYNCLTEARFPAEICDCVYQAHDKIYTKNDLVELVTNNPLRDDYTDSLRQKYFINKEITAIKMAQKICEEK